MHSSITETDDRPVCDVIKFLTFNLLTNVWIHVRPGAHSGFHLIIVSNNFK